MPLSTGPPCSEAAVAEQRRRVSAALLQSRLGGPRYWSWLGAGVTAHKAKLPVVETLLPSLISPMLRLHTAVTQRPQVLRETPEQRGSCLLCLWNYALPGAQCMLYVFI